MLVPREAIRGDGMVFDDYKSPIPTNLVLGSEGFLGQALCRYLERHEKVIRYDLKLDPAQDLRLAKLDLTGVDRVYLLAWDVGGAKYLYDPNTQEAQFEWNMKLLANTMPQLKGTRFLFVSSQQANQSNAYGVSKRIGEIWTKLLNGFVVRLWNLYGELEPTSERSHVVSDFVQQAKETGAIKMQTDGEERRQFVHLFDACRALHLAMEQQYTTTYDATSGNWISIRQIADFIATETGARVVPGWDSGKNFKSPYIGRMVGWSPDIPLEDGLRAIIRGETRKYYV